MKNLRALANVLNVSTCKKNYRSGFIVHAMVGLGAFTLKLLLCERNARGLSKLIL
jgi:hypothetical protein